MKARANELLQAACALLLACAFGGNAPAQGFTPVEARIASVTGSVLLSPGAGAAAEAAARGRTVAPGSVVDTRGGGQAVVELTDGSIVVVQPASVVVFRDFRQAESLRELFEITLGQVRVKINHFAGRPNPYRMNSPTASIAVRGTEFTVTVDSSGDTRVVVYEGAVEVTSLSDPSRQALVQGGQGVLVAPGLGFQMFTPTARDLEDRASNGTDRDHTNGRSTGGPQPGGPGGVPGSGPGGTQTADADQVTPRAQAGTYQRYIAGLESLNGLPLLLRYNAIPEAYLDSAENPAYATLFRAPEARVYLLPSLQGTPEASETLPGAQTAGIVPADYTMASEFAAFAPLAGGRVTIGGAVTGSYFSNTSRSNAGSDVDPGALGPIPSVAALVSSDKSLSRFLDGSFLVAAPTRLGSFGFQVETLRGTGSLSSTTPDPDLPGNTLQDTLSTSGIWQTRLTLGYRREIGKRHSLGVFTRYGFVNATNADVFNLVSGAPQPLSGTTSPGHTAEVGIRLRGALSNKLFYGMEGAWLGLSLRDGISGGGVPNALQRDRSHRESAGFGVSYLANARTVLTADFGFGVSDIAAARYLSADGSPLQMGTESSRFESVHVAVQREFGARWFLIASFMNVWQGNSLAYSVQPGAADGGQPLSDALFSASPAAYYSPAHLSDFGGGVRLSRNLLAQYIFSTDYGFSTSSHTLMLRYTLHFRD